MRERYIIPNYHVYRKDEKSPEGIAYRGLAVIVRKDIIHQLIPQQQITSFYALGVLISVGGQERRIFAAYKPPGDVLNLAELHNILLTNDCPTIIAGDFNMKCTWWNPSRTCAQGRRLYNDSEIQDYSFIGPDQSTHYTQHGGDVLDIAIYKGTRTPPTQQALPDLTSHHRPVLLVFTDLPARVMPPYSRTRTDWTIFARAAYGKTQSYPNRRLRMSNALRINSPTASEALLTTRRHLHHHHTPSAWEVITAHCLAAL